MNYLEHYNRLIDRAKNRNVEIDVYCEKHHYIPKSIFNNPYSHSILTLYNVKSINCKTNLVKLFPEEHIVAHLLLTKIFKNKNRDCFIKMVFAANMLKSRTRNNKEYGWLKRTHSLVMSELRRGKPSGALGKKWNESRIKLGCPHLKGKTYTEIFGEKKADELKKLRSDKLKQTWLVKRDQITNLMKNRKITWGEKISKSKLGISMSEDHKNKLKLFFGNDKLNPKVDQTLYEFENVKTGECIKARKIDMIKIYKCNRIYKMVSGETKICKGWKIKS